MNPHDRVRTRNRSSVCAMLLFGTISLFHTSLTVAQTVSSEDSAKAKRLIDRGTINTEALKKEAQKRGVAVPPGLSRSGFEGGEVVNKESLRKEAERRGIKIPEEYVKLVEQEDAYHGKVTRMHIIDDPLTPKGTVVDWIDLLPSGRGLAVIQHEFPCWSDVPINTSVIFRSKSPSEFAWRTLGNGVLLTRRLILTGRHVADDLERGKDSIDIILFRRTPLPSIQYLSWKKTISLTDNAEIDLSVIEIESVDTISFPTISSQSNVAIDDRVILAGAGESELLPRTASGSVVTVASSRMVSDQTSLFAFGTTLTSFPGQSGSPVYRCSKTIELIGIYVGGPKEYARTGEQIILAPRDSKKRQSFQDWSWVIPLSVVSDSLRAVG